MGFTPREMDFLDGLLRMKTTHEPENLPEHERCRAYVAEEAARHGLKTKIVPNDPYPSMIIGLDPDDKAPVLALSSHLDVVPAPPELFVPRVVENKLRARGASDMKFCLPLFFRVMDDLSPEQRAKVQIALTFDEEIGGNKGTRFLLDEYGYRPKVCFIPDGGDNFQIEADEKGVLQFRVRTSGKAAHGSRPWLGDNAIDRFLAIYADLRRAFPVVDRPGTWGPTLNLGKVTGGTAANAVPDTCEALLDVRFTEATSLAAITAQVREIVGTRGEFSPVVEGDLFHLDPTDFACVVIQRAAKEHRGSEMPIYRSEGASDARFFTKYGIPVVLTKPFCGGHHSPDEWMDLESLTPYYRMLLDFSRQIADNA